MGYIPYFGLYSDFSWVMGYTDCGLFSLWVVFLSVETWDPRDLFYRFMIINFLAPLFQKFIFFKKIYIDSSDSLVANRVTNFTQSKKMVNLKPEGWRTELLKFLNRTLRELAGETGWVGAPGWNVEIFWLPTRGVTSEISESTSNLLMNANFFLFE